MHAQAGRDHISVHVRDRGLGIPADEIERLFTRFYRASAGGDATVTQRLVVRDGTLEWLPQETIFFSDTQARTTTQVRLQGAARFIGWEIACYGRTAGDLPFRGGRATQRFEVWHDDAPRVIDTQRLDAGSGALAARWGLQGHTVIGTLLASPATAADVDLARNALGTETLPASAAH